MKLEFTTSRMHHPDVKNCFLARFRVEAWGIGTEWPTPLGTAYVMISPMMGAYIEYLVVMPLWKRMGVGTGLMNECLRRWPQAGYAAATPEGEAFLKSLGGEKVGA